MKCLRLVCLVSFIITPIFASDSDSDADWEDLEPPTRKIVSDDCSSEDSDTEISVSKKNDKVATIQLYLLDMRASIESIFNSLNCAQPNFDMSAVALSLYQCSVIDKVPSMLQELQRLKELQDASAQSKGDNKTKDNA